MSTWLKRIVGRLRSHARRVYYGVRSVPTFAWIERVRTRAAYRRRVERETAMFTGQVVVHDLPPIFHYWSNRWLRPEFEAFGFSNPEECFAIHLARACDPARTAGRVARIASLGCGNCDTEVRVASMLVARGYTDFTIECVDINDAMLARGRERAHATGMERHVVPCKGDFNDWQPNARYDAVLANQSLHHVTRLESLFSAIENSLQAHGVFVTSDIIGRNGHMRWPEALRIIHDYWAELPQAYRWNVQLRRHEESLEQWDCSVAGFEGIRAQDILPLLVDRFAFELFIGYGNLVDPFIDRGFGPHFDANGAWDRDFIDRVHARDEREMRAGTITPTHMVAVLRRRPWDGPRLHRQGLPVEACVRRAEAAA